MRTPSQIIKIVRLRRAARQARPFKVARLLGIDYMKMTPAQFEKALAKAWVQFQKEAEL